MRDTDKPNATGRRGRKEEATPQDSSNGTANGVVWEQILRKLRDGASLTTLAEDYLISRYTLTKGLKKRFGEEAYRDAIRDHQAMAGRMNKGQLRIGAGPSNTVAGRLRVKMPKQFPRGSDAGKLFAAGWRESDIAAAMGYSTTQSAHAFFAHLPEYQDRKQEHIDRWEAILELHAKGWTSTEIANAIGVTRTNIVVGLRRRNKKPNYAVGNPRGGKPAAVFDVRAAWQQFSNGVPVSRIAKHIKVSPNSIAKRFRQMYGDAAYEDRLDMPRVRGFHVRRRSR
jgi:AraC-like DNA-binding protein